MKTQIPERGGLTLRADSVWALYGLDGRVQPAVGTGLRVWIPSRDEDAEAERAARDLTATLAALDALQPAETAPPWRPVQSWGWNWPGDPPPATGGELWERLRTHAAMLITGALIAYVGWAMLEAFWSRRLP